MTKKKVSISDLNICITAWKGQRLYTINFQYKNTTIFYLSNEEGDFKVIKENDLFEMIDDFIRKKYGD